MACTVAMRLELEAEIKRLRAENVAMQEALRDKPGGTVAAELIVLRNELQKMKRSEMSQADNQTVCGSEDGTFVYSGVAVRIHLLPDAALRVVEPILATVERLGDDNYLSSAPAIHCHMSGDTGKEALSNLADVIVDRFNRYDSLPAERLGYGPKKNLAAMRQHIERVGGR